MKKIIIILLAFVLVSFAVAETVNRISDRVEKVEDCVDYVWEEEEKVYGTCSDIRAITVCVNETINKKVVNTSCHTELMEFNYSCVRETNLVEKSRTECVTKGFVVNEIIKLHTKDYVCLTEENKDEVIVICDSKFDGNGDGICTGGESCMKFVIDDDKVEKYERNSRYDWVKSDKSFFLERASVEVLK